MKHPVDMLIYGAHIREIAKELREQQRQTDLKVVQQEAPTEPAEPIAYTPEQRAEEAAYNAAHAAHLLRVANFFQTWSQAHPLTEFVPLAVQQLNAITTLALSQG